MHRHAVHIGGRTIHRNQVVGNGLGGSVLLNAEGSGNVGCGVGTASAPIIELAKRPPVALAGGVLGDAHLGEKLEKLMVKPLLSKKPPNISF